MQFSEGYLATIDLKSTVRIYDAIEKDVPPVLLNVFLSEDEQIKDAKVIDGFDLLSFKDQTILFVYFNKIIETYLYKVDGGSE